MPMLLGLRQALMKTGFRVWPFFSVNGPAKSIPVLEKTALGMTH